MLAPILLAISATGNADLTVVVDLKEGALQVQESWMIRLDQPVPAGEMVLPLPAGAERIAQPQDQEGWVFDDGRGHIVNQTDLASGRTHIFYNYDLPYASPNVTLRREQPAVHVQGLRLAVPQLDSLRVGTAAPASRTERELNGVPFELIDVLEPFQGQPTFSADLSGLPVRPLWPRWLAVAISVALVLFTLYLVTTARGSKGAADRPELQARKERLMQALQILEEDRSSLEPRAYDRRRNELLGDLADVLRQEAR
jgi:hypothetical protein